MKFLALLFLAGLGLAAAIPSSFHEIVMDFPVEDFDEFYFLAEDVETELQNRLSEILEKIEEEWENRKIVMEDIRHIQKLNDVSKKMKEFGVETGAKAMELINILKNKASKTWRGVLDQLFPSKKAVNVNAFFADEDVKIELQNRLSEILEKIREEWENRKIDTKDISQVQKLNDVSKKMKESGVEIGAKAKELINILKNKASKSWRGILDQLFPSKLTVEVNAFFDDE